MITSNLSLSGEKWRSFSANKMIIISRQTRENSTYSKGKADHEIEDRNMIIITMGMACGSKFCSRKFVFSRSIQMLKLLIEAFKTKFLAKTSPDLDVILGGATHGLGHGAYF